MKAGWLCKLVTAIRASAHRWRSWIAVSAAVLSLLVLVAASDGLHLVEHVVVGDALTTEIAEGSAPSSKVPLAAQVFACQDDPELPRIEQQTILDPVHGQLVRLVSGGDSVRVAYHPVPGAKRAILWLSGADGGLDGPFDGFYAQLAKRFQAKGYASVRLDYTTPADLDASVRDALLVLRFLAQEGICNVGVVGFSFGGAVAIETAALRPQVQAVVTIASQSLGTDNVGQIAPRPLLVIYPVDDEVVPGWASEDIYERAGEPKEVVRLLARDHYLADSAADVQGLVLSWLPSRLGGAPATEDAH